MSVKEALDFDASSALLDEYEDMASAYVAMFKARPLSEKLCLVGALLAALTVLFPWTVTVSPAGVEDPHLGLLELGWLSAILAAAAVAVAWVRNFSRSLKIRPLHLVFVQLVLAAVGILWGLVAYVAALRLEPPPVNPRGVEPGPTYGLYLHLLAWAVTLAGGLLALRDAERVPPGWLPKPPEDDV
ncbi:MAG: hypothetical protein D6729_00345 [Deltaproteobacteria bacterium]|nr:MAG: hypothetical protein D6729_00345 [Deltaproteobacteria bacterium]